jgi:hypothetical protein
MTPPAAASTVGFAALVEFSDDQGRAQAVVPCSPAALLVLHHASEAA